MDDAVLGGVGRRLDGHPNRDLNVGAIVALSPALGAATKQVLNSWGPGRYDAYRVTPEPNDVSKSLQQGAEEAKAKLGRLSGSAFDAAYMEREVGYHQAVLDAIDGLLIPTTENAELKQLLQTVRPAIVAHLERARTIQRELAQQ